MVRLMKLYTAQEAALLLSTKDKKLTYLALLRQLERDAKNYPRDKSKCKYPNARKCECGKGWLIPGKDITLGNNKK
jgi:hypothetical protein